MPKDFQDIDTTFGRKLTSRLDEIEEAVRRPRTMIGATKARTSRNSVGFGRGR